MDNSNLNKAYLEVLNKDSESRLDTLIKKYTNEEAPSKEGVITLFNIALEDEFLAEYNYFASYNLSKTEGKSDFDPEFEKHEDEERGHRKEIVQRLRELGARVPTQPLNTYFTDNSAGESWHQESSSNSIEILKNRYKEELGAIKFYSMFFTFLKKFPQEQRDTTSEMLVKHLKADEEEHAKDLKDLLIEYGVSEADL